MKKVTRYLERQAEVGRGTAPALVRLPWEIARSYFRMAFPERNCPKHGYRMFDKPLLASYSRSGTNWIRFIIEDISGLPTPGKECLHPHGLDPFVVDRSHKAYACMKRHPSVLMVVRDYRECLLRQHTALWLQNPKVAEFLVDRSEQQPPVWYIRNIEAFDRYPGTKLLLYYEDLVTGPQNEIPRIAEFLALDSARTADFVANIDEKFARSVGVYTSAGRASNTGASKDIRYHAKKHLSDAQQREFDAFYRERYPELYEKYLKRYAVE